MEIGKVSRNNYLVRSNFREESCILKRVKYVKGLRENKEKSREDESKK